MGFEKRFDFLPPLAILFAIKYEVFNSSYLMLKYINIVAMKKKLTILCVLFCCVGSAQVSFNDTIVVGAARNSEYMPILSGKRVAVLGNQTSMVASVHTVDRLLDLGVDVRKVFAPEHGFRGKADAGEKINDGLDAKTGLPIKSLHGRKKKPSKEDLYDVDVVVFDIQDVGARFYTYISTMHYIMESCAEQNKEFVVFDRPNPNGHYVDGPLLKEGNESFVGMHPVPIVHGMTIGEYAQMINGEGWLSDGVNCNLQVIPCEGYDHNSMYELPVKPSPNLPNMASIYLYPSLCLFEGTQVSIGRGTEKQFQLVGSPFNGTGDYRFTPIPRPGAKKPKHEGLECVGYDLSDFGANQMPEVRSIYLHWLIAFYNNSSDKERFFRKDGFFRLLTGDRSIRKMIEEGRSAEQISRSWADDVKAFMKIREKYLLYPDFKED